MPEGDTIHKLARAMAPDLVGRRLRGVKGTGIDGRALAGRRVEGVCARGKHLFIELDGGVVLRTHLGMRGAWHRYRTGEAWKRPGWQSSLVLETGEEVFVCFNARAVECLSRDGVRHRALLGRLGPDLLSPGFDPARVAHRVRALVPPETSLADVLLDQRVACGIGNVYKSEVLFIEALGPERPAGTVSDAALEGLYRTAGALLGRNLGGGRRRTRFVDDGLGPLWVYGRRGFPCLRCDGTIRASRVGRDLRITYWCPGCQGSERDPARGPGCVHRHTGESMAVEEGKAAPAFTLPDTEGNKVSLKDLKGSYVVVYFYPRDDTPGCTKEACGFRDLWGEIEAHGAVVLGISPDGAESHRKFVDKYGLPFTLLSDPDRKVMTRYGAYGEKTMYGKKTMGVIRSTVLVGPDGKVRKHWRRVAKAADHPAKVLEVLAADAGD